MDPRASCIERDGVPQLVGSSRNHTHRGRATRSGEPAADRRTRRPPAGLHPQSSPNGQVTPAASARCRYSWTVPRPIEQLRAISRSPRPTSNFNRRTSLILRTDNLLAGKQSSFLGRLPAIVLSSAVGLWKLNRRSRTRFRDRPKTVRFIPESVFTFIPEHCSDSPRNAVQNHPGIAFMFPRIPPEIGWDAPS